MELKIETLPIDKLNVYENNTKTHTEEDVEFIKNSIETFGFNDPIGIWSDDNIIVEGHGRLEAAKELGMTEVPCIRLDHLTDEQRRAYSIIHNQLTLNSGWDFIKLENESLILEDIDLTKYGLENMDFNFIDEDFDYLFNDEEKIKEVKKHKCPYCGVEVEV